MDSAGSQKLGELLAAGWAVSVSRNPSGTYDVVLAASMFDLHYGKGVKASNSGFFTDLSEALEWCEDGLRSRGVTPS